MRPTNTERVTIDASDAFCVRACAKKTAKIWTEVMAFSMNHPPTSYTLTSNGFRMPNESFHWQLSGAAKSKTNLGEYNTIPKLSKNSDAICRVSVCERVSAECDDHDEWVRPRIPKYYIKTILMKFAAVLPVFIAITRWLFSVCIHWSSS